MTLKLEGLIPWLGGGGDADRGLTLQGGSEQRVHMQQQGIMPRGVFKKRLYLHGVAALGVFLEGCEPSFDKGTGFLMGWVWGWRVDKVLQYLLLRMVYGHCTYREGGGIVEISRCRLVDQGDFKDTAPWWY